MGAGDDDSEPNSGLRYFEEAEELKQLLQRVVSSGQAGVEFSRFAQIVSARAAGGCSRARCYCRRAPTRHPPQVGPVPMLT